MRPGQQIPIQHEREARPLKRRHSASYYVHRARDSLTTRVSKIICGIFLTLLFIGGVAAFIAWLSLRPHRPRIHIRDFSIPGLEQPTGSDNAEIIFNITARNSNQAIGYYYDSVEALVYYRSQVLSGATLNMTSDLWTEFTKDRAVGTVVFRVDITGLVRFKVSTWDSKRHRMHTNCDVGVSPDGSILA
ncbi:hypothetical protein OIU77_021980, partial [Salix suchowensis]